jgi:anti-sigma B factor antagonist
VTRLGYTYARTHRLLSGQSTEEATDACLPRVQGAKGLVMSAATFPLTSWTTGEPYPIYRVEIVHLGRGEFVVALHGEIDLAARPSLEAELTALADRAARRVVVDLTATRFIDASTLGLLTCTARRLREDGGELVLVCADPHIGKILRITLLDRLFTIFETRTAALVRGARPLVVVNG